MIPASDLFTTTIISTGTLFTVETFEAQTLCLGKVPLQINTKLSMIVGQTLRS